MKLYTEEQVRKAIELARDTHPEGRDYLQREEYDYSDDEVIDLLTPIELPSDEDIKNEIGYDWFDPEDIAFFGGIDYLRSKIQGGNNEQQ